MHLLIPKDLSRSTGIITQVANGDLSKRVQIQSAEMDDEIAAFKVTINTMMDQLEIFSSEVTRVAHEVGTEGILGGWEVRPRSAECTESGKN